MRVYFPAKAFIRGRVYPEGVREFPDDHESFLHSDCEVMDPNTPETSEDIDPTDDMKALSELAPKTAQEVAALVQRVAELEAEKEEPAKKPAKKPSLIDKDGDGKVDVPE